MKTGKTNEAKKLTAQFVLACIIVFVGLGLLVAGFFLPPLATIDSSVLIAWGEVATFAGSLIGVDYHYKYKINRNNDSEIDG